MNIYADSQKSCIPIKQIQQVFPARSLFEVFNLELITIQNHFKNKEWRLFLANLLIIIPKISFFITLRLELIYFNFITSNSGLVLYFIFMCLIHSINFKNKLLYFYLFGFSIELLFFALFLIILFNTKKIRLFALETVGTEFALKRLGDGIPGLFKFLKLFIPVVLIISIYVFTMLLDIYEMQKQLKPLMEINRQCVDSDSDFCKQNFEKLINKEPLSIFQKIKYRGLDH